jgi:predicted enzyme related to lactoylglutathione lyase
LTDSNPGAIAWTDLTINSAETVRDFYAAVTGWKHEPVDMGGYSDFVMTTPSGDGVAGICHARGSNEGLPAQWLIYINVESLDKSIDAVNSGGGKVIAGPKSMGKHRYCVIQDPAGAVAALIEST